jgi:hypothetical protein
MDVTWTRITSAFRVTLIQWVSLYDVLAVSIVHHRNLIQSNLIYYVLCFDRLSDNPYSSM